MILLTSTKLSHAITLTEHQVEIVKQAREIFNKRSLVYISAEERVGKTFAALELVVPFALANPEAKVLIVTKKKALVGWEYSLKNYYAHGGDITWELINYESLHKIENKSPNLVIVDEAHHALSAYPKPSKTARLLQDVAYRAPVIFLSATPCAQSYSQLFHQLNISKFSPWDSYRNFYEWFRWYGVPQVVYTSSGQVMKYDTLRPNVVDDVFEKYFVAYSRKQANFLHEPNDVVHYVDVPEELAKLLKQVKTKKVLSLPNGETLSIDNISKEIKVLHQLEGSTIKLDEKRSLSLDFDFKIAKIKELFGDTEDLAIFYEYKQEKKLLDKHFKNALILQGSTFAEGVDLSHIGTLVIYSMNFSAAKYAQRRARQCNINRDKSIDVHFILAKGCISEMVYECVVHKHKNFTSYIYTREYGGG